MKKALPLSLAVAVAGLGCSTASKDITPMYVSPIQYQAYDCQQLGMEKARIQARVSEIGGRLDQAAENDKALTAVGVVLFWPTLFFLGGTKQQEAEYARLKGEYDALHQTAIGKNCAGAGTAVMAAMRGVTVGDRWVYEYTDQWKPDQKIRVTHVVTAVNGGEVREHVSASVNRNVVTTEAHWPASTEVREWKLDQLVMREFSPFALALGILQPGQPPARVETSLADMAGGSDWSVQATTAAPEAVSVPAGTFTAHKIVLKGKRPLGSVSGIGRPHTFEMTVWYAAETGRYVKLTFDSYAQTGALGSGPQNRERYELVSLPQRQP